VQGKKSIFTFVSKLTFSKNREKAMNERLKEFEDKREFA